MTTESVDMTQRRIDAAWKVIIKELVNVYEIKQTPKVDFWPTYDREERALTEKLRKRPLGMMEMESMFNKFRAMILKAL
jgi:hypothetical protein